MLYEAKQGSKAYEYIKSILDAEFEEHQSYMKRVEEAVGFEFEKYLKVGGKLVIIDCNKGHYKTNVFLDNLWYRFVGNNNEIFISKQYRDYINVLIKLGFKQLYYKSFKEKEITKYECN